MLASTKSPGQRRAQADDVLIDKGLLFNQWTSEVYYATLLTVLADASAAEQTRPQMHRLGWLILDHARAIHIRETRAKRCA